MKKISILFLCLTLIYSIKAFANKLIFNQIITSQENVTIQPLQGVVFQGVYINPFRKLLGVVPAGKAWKGSLGVSVSGGSSINGSVSIEVNGVLFQGSTSYGGWMKAGDSVYVVCTSGNGTGTPYNIICSSNIVEFNVVP
jgi:hypothetical protein